MMFDRRILVGITAGAASLVTLPAHANQSPSQYSIPASLSSQQQQIPARPRPPRGASEKMVVPAVGRDGTRMTVNANLNAAETTWNLRSGMNVAALNCLAPRHKPILTAYKSMLQRHKNQFSAANTALESQFRRQYGRGYQRVRDNHMTKVYNYFSLPPVRARMCDAAVSIANGYLASPPSDIDSYAADALPQLEAAFESFYSEFEAYRADVAAWDAKYGARYGQQAGRSYASTATYGPQGSVSGSVIQGQTTSASGASVLAN